MVSLGVVGATGRLGTAIVAACAERSVEIALTANTKEWISHHVPAVLVDASRPAAFDAVEQYVLARRIPLLTVVSGYDSGMYRRLRVLARHVPVLHAANLSQHHQLQLELTSAMANFAAKHDSFDDWTVSIHDRHPPHKRDKPSATAKAIAHRWRTITGDDPAIDSTRCGMPVCEHTISLGDADEEIMLSHRVRTMQPYARRAVDAARWLATGRRPGLYDIQDVS